MSKEYAILSIFRKVVSDPSNSPGVAAYADAVSVSENKDFSVSVLFQNNVVVKFSHMKDCFSVLIAKDYFSLFDSACIPIPYKISNIPSAPNLIRLLIDPSYTALEKLTSFVVKCFLEYCKQHYTPTYYYDCCSRYAQCSDAMRCVNPDPVHAQSCNYRKKLESGIVYFGKNRNVD